MESTVAIGTDDEQIIERGGHAIASRFAKCIDVMNLNTGLREFAVYRFEIEAADLAESPSLGKNETA